MVTQKGVGRVVAQMITHSLPLVIRLLRVMTYGGMQTSFSEVFEIFDILYLQKCF